jgi:eukaryotic-like serine/threonine-protein kinase
VPPTDSSPADDGSRTETALNIDAYRTLLKRAGIDASALSMDPSGTLAVSIPEMSDAVRALPSLATELTLRAAIARGGMGQIRLARQRALGRDVAVKCAVPGSSDRHHAAAALVQEGRITGALEHPNIVPIHALGRTDDGDTLLVMKRIEGDVWSDLLSRRPTTSHELERHVAILIDVCRAIHFAHARGVVHRDLKPANVMVGAFGEVYVLDWGIAVCVDRHDTIDTGGNADTNVDTIVPGAPLATDVKNSIAGTPQYMAPEMALPGEPVDVRTDVFLLGAILHVILTGRPPHAGANVAEILCAAAAWKSYAFHDDVLSELGAICKRALARERADRFASADELRLALVAFLRHDGARALVVEANAQLRALTAFANAANLMTSTDANVEAKAFVTLGANTVDADVVRAQDLDVARAFSAARFGFAAALRAWPESPEARRGLRDTLATMARWEIRRRHIDAARVLVAELDDAPVDVVDGLRTLEREERAAAEQRAALEANARALDPKLGVGLRVVISFAVAVAWCGFALGQGASLRAGHPPSSVELGVAYLVTAGAFAVAGLLLWRRRVGNVNPAYFAAGGASLAVIAWEWLALAPPIHAGMALAHVIFSLGVVGCGLFVERRLLWAAAASFAGAPLAYLFPMFCFETNVVATMATLVVVMGALRKRP